MKEISPKLANELLDRIEKLEAWCDERAKDEMLINGKPNWRTASVMAFEIRQHLLWHTMAGDVCSIPDLKLSQDGKYSVGPDRDNDFTDERGKEDEGTN